LKYRYHLYLITAYGTLKDWYRTGDLEPLVGGVIEARQLVLDRLKQSKCCAIAIQDFIGKNKQKVAGKKCLNKD